MAPSPITASFRAAGDATRQCTPYRTSSNMQVVKQFRAHTDGRMWKRAAPPPPGKCRAPNTIKRRSPMPCNQPPPPGVCWDAVKSPPADAWQFTGLRFAEGTDGQSLDEHYAPPQLVERFCSDTTLLCFHLVPDDVEPRRQLADPGILERDEVHRNRVPGFIVADVAPQSVLRVAGVTLDE
jgi:hypothetical protein